jgi:hypothetical protein
MDRCTNQKLGRLLHDYELNMLLAEDRRAFELHLYECDYCLGLIHEFTDASLIILHDSEAKEIVADIANESTDLSSRRIRKKPLRLTNWLIAAAIVLALAIPSYLIWLQPQEATVVQTLELFPTRAGGSDVVYLEKGGDVEINFFAAESFRGRAYVTISNIAGDTVYSKVGFSHFNNSGLGLIRVPVSIFSPGNFKLTISPDPETGVEERTYMFRVK